MTRIPRRQFLKLTGGSAAIGLAGCMGSRDDGGDGGGDGGGSGGSSGGSDSGGSDSGGSDGGGGSGSGDEGRPDEHQEILDYWLDQAKEEDGSFKLYTSIPTETANLLMEEFTNEFGIEGGEVFRSSTFDTYSRYLEEVQADADTADIISISDHAAHMDMRDDDMLLPYECNQYQYYPDELTDPEYFTTPRVLVMTMVWSQEFVNDEDVPADWRESANLDPDEWSGQISIGDPRGGGTSLSHFNALEMEYGDELWEWVEKWAELDAGSYTSHGSMTQDMRNGQYPLALENFMYRANEVLREDPDAPIGWQIPEGDAGGATVATGPMSITGQTDRPATAKLFMEWALSEAGSEIIMDGFSGYSPRDPAPIEWEHIPSAYQELNTLPTDFERQRKERERIQNTYDEIISS